MVDAWTAVRARLDAELASLGAGDALVLSEPDGPAPERPAGLLGRWRRPPRPPVRYVQFLRQDDGYAGECVSGAHWDVTPEQDRVLRAAGWSAPRTGEAAQTDNYARFVPDDGRTQLAAVAVDALATLGCDPATAWDWLRISD